MCSEHQKDGIHCIISTECRTRLKGCAVADDHLRVSQSLRTDAQLCAAGLLPNNRRHIRNQIANYATKPDAEKAAHLQALVEGYLITDPAHHCLQHNLRKLQGVDVRVNGERGLRAKRVG